MLSARHQRHAVEDLAVQFRLARQACERIAVALEFEAAKLAVDDSHIDSNGTSPDAHLLDDVGAVVADVLRTKVLAERRANIVVAHVVASWLRGRRLPRIAICRLSLQCRDRWVCQRNR